MDIKRYKFNFCSIFLMKRLERGLYIEEYCVSNGFLHAFPPTLPINSLDGRFFQLPIRDKCNSRNPAPYVAPNVLTFERVWTNGY